MREPEREVDLGEQLVIRRLVRERRTLRHGDETESESGDERESSRGACEGAQSSGGIGIQVVSGSNAVIPAAACSVPSPRSFCQTTPSWLTMNDITPLEP